MLFSSRNRTQIEHVRAKLASSGIRCEVRFFHLDASLNGTSCYPELWVEANSDYHTASILYASPVGLLQRAKGQKTGGLCRPQVQ